MAQTSLNISLVEKRMMSASEAAHYCGLPVKHFKASCPVRPVELPRDNLRYDKSDLDDWIDGLKSMTGTVTQAEIIGRL